MPIVNATSLAVPLTRSQITAAVEIDRSIPDFADTQKAIAKICREFPGFGREASRKKTEILRNRYHTLPPVASADTVECVIAHVVDALNNVSVSSAGLEVVEKLTFVPPEAGKPPRNLPTFASKFAFFFIDELRFPIYDSIAFRMVKYHLGKKGRLTWGSPPPTDWYHRWVENINRLIKRSGVDCSYSDLDCYLWIAGKYRAWKSTGQGFGGLIGAFSHPSPNQRRWLSQLEMPG